MLALLLFSAIVQGGDHIDRLIHRPALVADDRAVSDQHIPAAPKRLGIGCVNDAALNMQFYTVVCRDRLHIVPPRTFDRRTVPRPYPVLRLSTDSCS